MTSLYDELGGRDAVEAAVEIFYKKVLGDAHINHFFTRTDIEAQKQKQTLFLTMAFGGPNHYTGKKMRQAHKHLVEKGLNESHFNAVAGHLLSTLQELKVPDTLIEQVMTIAASTKEDVLNL